MSAAGMRDTIRDWFRHLERCVRAADYDGARPIFAPDVLGFGTHGALLEGLDALASGQWQHVWPNIRGFTFDLERLHCGVDGDLAWAICLWDSEGQRADGTRFARPGRATVIFRRDGDRWLAIHTHFSLFPS
jgi:ketosteroid isomerase-like protein